MVTNGTTHTRTECTNLGNNKCLSGDFVEKFHYQDNNNHCVIIIIIIINCSLLKPMGHVMSCCY